MQTFQRDFLYPASGMLKNFRTRRNFFSYYGIKLCKIDFFFRKLIDLHPATDIVADKGRVYKVIISK